MDNNTHLKILQRIADVSPEYIYVMDFDTASFHFVDANYFSGWKWKSEEQKNLNLAFYERTTYPDDRLMARVFYHVIQKKMLDMSERGEDLSQIAYFSYSYRLLMTTDNTSAGEVMVKLKIAPILINGQPRYGALDANCSLETTPGHLEMVYNNYINYEFYNMKDEKWHKGRLPQLNWQEQQILLQTCTGKDFKNIAEALHLSEQTIRNTATRMYRRLGVSSITQAVLYAADHRLLFAPPSKHSAKPAPQKPQPVVKGKLTQAMLDNIQKEWNNGRSINSIAKHHNLSEGSIRYAIKKGRLISPHRQNIIKGETK